ncbi:hypothetical protein ACIBJE_24900 [Micromonospora sp. NPDC050187]|uniref:hypothetical protein n=1 Tax=Micromonospora sp. NPDC050187 TaxID=3364277 RepID=UPI00378A1CFE
MNAELKRANDPQRPVPPSRPAAGHFPTEQAAMKGVYLVGQQKREGGGCVTGRIYGWAKALDT